MNAGRRRRLIVGLIAFVVLALVAVLWGVGHIEDDRAAAVESQLTAAGVSGVSVSFDGRTGTLTGPADLRDAALAAVTDRSGIRDLEYETPSGSAGATTSAPATTAPPVGPDATTTPPTTGAPATGVTATVAGTGITLTGPIAAEERRATLVTAAQAAFGPANVADQLTVDAAAPAPTAAAAEAFDAYVAASAIGLRSGTATLDGSTLTVAGTAFSPSTVAGLNARLGQARDAGLTVNGTVQAPGSADIATLQASLNELVGRAGITFPASSAQISEASQAVLDVVATVIASGPANAQIEVGGHTDSAGTEAINAQLSELRARAVLAYLVGQGVAAGRLSAVGYGAGQPIGDNATEAGRAQNRRIALTVTEA